MGVATDCSMVTASAPVYVVVRFTCGGRICGNCAMGRLRSDTIPMSTVRMAMTIATVGRRTKNAESIARLLQLRRASPRASGADDPDADGVVSGDGRGSTVA